MKQPLAVMLIFNVVATLHPFFVINCGFLIIILGTGSSLLNRHCRCGMLLLTVVSGASI